MARKIESEPSRRGLLSNPHRRAILLALWSEGPMSLVEFHRSRFGKGTDLNQNNYHLGTLVDAGLVARSHDPKREERPKYSLTEAFTQEMADSLALDGIHSVLEGIPIPLKRWFEGPYVDSIAAFVEASRRPVPYARSDLNSGV